MEARLVDGGRLIYAGAGTSGGLRSRTAPSLCRLSVAQDRLLHR
jgi:N-acetylmuramic acid 6-phosphate (MurNAc-6-P) etherase